MRPQHPLESTAFANVTGAVTQKVLTHRVTTPLCSLDLNELGPKGGAAVAEALKGNDTITNIK